MSVRNKRLTNDFKALSELVRNSGGSLKIISKEGNPPYKYVIEYRCKGVEKVTGNTPIFRHNHQVQIVIGTNYPKEKPDTKFITPIYHPNVWPDQNICLGSYWTMSETLPELVLRIGKIIQYSKDVLNLSSPANATAKQWAAQNMSLFPVDNQTFKIKIVWNDF